MQIRFCVAADRYIDTTLADAFAAGCGSDKDQCIISDEESCLTVDPADDVVVIAGVKSLSKRIFDAHQKAGKIVLLMDKGYTRIKNGSLGGAFWRVSINEFQPHAYFRSTSRPGDRLPKMGVSVVRTRSIGSRIIFAGSSPEFCAWHGLGDATEYAVSVMQGIRDRIDLPIFYRPKPSWKDAKPVDGFGYSEPKTHLPEELRNAYALVTYGSNACFEALMHGVPVIVLGDGIARSLAGISLDDISTLRLPSYEEREQLACDVSYCQWTLEEIARGRMWRHLRSCWQFHGGPA